ncbi:hypothetical protein NY2A_b071R [Paramecium bursaria Chlorella virus NY2A]|uniref:Uncharacterized protein b071R n=1 Tax=Paramecium bursaria Chlorella virus NY2A TaxID=46021 RepID=A7IVU6_PBCVN|nr:hypothetical protein NY2A_b071R [Paramecium bursaria Chlorella virus NY2A]ABT14470.1 hypothetical protein NY2A_b071R [Paramecium bursaria Chlorella virus NY2A]
MLCGGWFGPAFSSFWFHTMQWNVQRIRYERRTIKQNACEFMDCFEHAERTPSSHWTSECFETIRKTRCGFSFRET